MRRASLCLGVVAAAVFAGCGGGRDDFDDELNTLLIEQGFEEEQADCVIDELDDSGGNDPIVVSDGQIDEISESGELTPEVQQAALDASAQCAQEAAAPGAVPPGGVPPPPPPPGPGG